MMILELLDALHDLVTDDLLYEIHDVQYLI